MRLMHSGARSIAASMAKKAYRRALAITPSLLDRPSSESAAVHNNNNDYCEWRKMKASTLSYNTVNPIRLIVDSLYVSHNPDKELIRLHIGDPTLTGNLPPSEVAIGEHLLTINGKMLWQL